MPTLRSTALLVSLLAFSAPAGAEEIVLAPARRAGDIYTLALHTKSESVFRASRARRAPPQEAVELSYEAKVTALAVDATGLPTRERHEDVRLGFERADETGSLFDAGVAFDVAREGGDVEISSQGRRIDRRLEKIVTEILASQFEYTGAPALLDPGRAVEVGETWTLDGKRARKYLRSRGVRAIELEGDATATLAGDDEGALQVRYRIPVAWWRPARLPANASVAKSDAQVEGVVTLASDERPLRHTAQLVTRASGVVTATGYAAPAPWTLTGSASSDQRTRVVPRSLAANF